MELVVKGLGLAIAIVRTIVRGNCEINNEEAALLSRRNLGEAAQ